MGCTHSVRYIDPASRSKGKQALAPSARGHNVAAAEAPGDAVHEIGGPAKGTTEESDFERLYRLGKKLGEGSFGEVRIAEHKFFPNLPTAVKILEVERNMVVSSGHSSQSDAVHRPYGVGQGSSRRAGSKGRRKSSKTTASTKPGWSMRAPKIAGGQAESADFLTKFQKVASTEIAMLKAVTGHPNTVAFHEAFCEQTKCYIVTELCARGTLVDYLFHENRVMLPELQRVFSEMALGVAHIHKAGIMHRDIKPSNFLVGGADGGDGEKGRTVKLADFGAATLIPRDGSTLRRSCGTAPYMSPEMIEDEGYCERTDVWSMGVSYYCIVYGEFPYCPDGEWTSKKMKASVARGVPEPRFKQNGGKQVVTLVTDDVEDLVRNCLERDVTQRPSSRRVIQHSFFHNVKMSMCRMVTV